MRVSLPSPTAAALGKFGDVPVSLATGTPEVAIPLFTLRGRTLELPIALRYHASGVRVEEIGGWAGLGWALEAGGAITRTVRGLVDETPNGYYWKGNTWFTASAWPTPSTSILDDVVDERLDGEPDQFFFTLPGRSGQFVMGPTNGSPTSQEVRTIPYQKLRIVPNDPSNITSWEITTEDGTRYTFAAVETNTDFNITNPGGEIPAHYGDTYISTWQLTQILAPGGDSLTFHYTPYQATHGQGTYREKFDEVLNPVGPACVPAFFESITNFGVTTQRLDSIQGAAHTVRFVAASTLRSDALSLTGVPQEPRLEKVVVTTPSGTVLREFHLAHDYSVGGRLTLRSVQEKDRTGAALPPFDLTYVAGTFPSRTSFAQDHYGYYNGKSANTTLIPQGQSSSGAWFPGADRSADGTFARIGALQRITYPTGGSTEFTYEAHDYGGIGLNDSPPAGSGPPQFANAFAGFNEGSVTTPFTVGGNATVLATVTVNMDPACGTQLGCPYAEIVGVGTWTAPGTYSVNLPVGNHTLHAAEEFIGGFAQISVSWQDWVVQKKKPAGGIRVSELRDVDPMGVTTIRQFRYVLGSDLTRSSGVVDHEPDYDYNVSFTNCTYYSRASVSKAPLGSGPVVAYREVAVHLGASGEFGQTVHRFRTAFDAIDEPLAFGQSPGLRRTSREWQRGQSLGRSERSAAGVVQARSASVWAFKSDTLVEPVAVRRFRGLSINSFSAAEQVLFGSNASAVAFNAFDVTAGWAHPVADTLVTYDEAGAGPVTAVKNFQYANATHAQLTTLLETAPGGARRVTRSRYAGDFAPGGTTPEAQAIALMAGSAHMPGVVLEEAVHDSLSTLLTLTASLTTFRLTPAGQMLPYERFMLDAPAPASALVPAQVSAGALVKDSRYVRLETASSYDPWGRLLTLTDPREKVTTYTYGGNIRAAFLTSATRVKDATGTVDLVATLDWDLDGNLRRVTDEAGRKTHFGYDLFGRLTHRWNHDSLLVTQFAYSYSRTLANGWVFAPATPNAVTSTTYLQQAPTPKSVVQQEFLDGLGRPIQGVLQGGATYYVVATQYDAMGRPMRRWKPYTRTGPGYDPSFAANATSAYNTYHAASNAKPYDSTAYTTDPLGRTKRETPPFLGTTATAFRLLSYGTDAALQQVYVARTDEMGKVGRAYRNILGVPARSQLGYGAAEQTTTSLTHDGAGRRIQAADPRGILTTNAYSTRGLPLSTANVDAGTVTRKFDRAGNLRFSQDAKQAGAGQVFFTTYDFAGRPLVVGQGAGTLGALDPDAASPSALESTAANWLTVRAYDVKPATSGYPWSLFSAEIAPLTLQRVSGRLAAEAHRSNGAWQVTLFSFNGEGRVATRWQFTQNSAGTAVWSALNTTLVSTFDLRDSLTYRALTVGSANWFQWTDYDDRGLLWKVFAATTSTKPATADVTYTYRPSGVIATRQYSGGPTVPFTYSIREQLARIGDPAVTTYPFSARYTYHANGTVSEAEFYQAGTPATAKRYRYVVSAANYDALNRLKGADFSPWSGTAWTSTLAYDLTNITYDGSGNLTGLRRYRSAATLVDQLTYAIASTSNRLTSVTDAIAATAETWDAETGALSHDANGNLLTAPGPYAITATTHDAWNRPLTRTRAGTTSAYRYAAGGQRISKQVGTGAAEVYITDGPATLAVFTVPASGTPSAWQFNLMVGDRPIGRQPSSGSRLYYHRDLLNSTRAVVTGTTVVESRDYDPWGVELAGRTLGSGTREGFTGQERDAESGLDAFWARGYLPALGRWASVDPLRDSFPEWSPYNYVEGDPVSYSDPFGLCPPVASCLRLAFFSAAADGPAPIGDVIAVGLLGTAVVLAMKDAVGDLALPTSRAEPREREAPDVFHRLESPTQTVADAMAQQASRELWGKGYRDSGVPYVQAYTGPLPPGARGIEFVTSAQGFKYSKPGAVMFVPGQPGVRLEDGVAKIDIIVTKNTQVP
jgi:RHS repeat-associated protein